MAVLGSFAIVLAALTGASAFAVGSRTSALHRSLVRPARFIVCAAASEGEEDSTDPVDDDAPMEGMDDLLSSPAFMKKKIEVLEDEIAQLQTANSEMRAKLDEETRSPQVLRLQADFENFRRRTSEQMLDQKTLATIDCMKQLLPVIDNYDRASTVKLTAPEAIKIQNSYNQLNKQLLDVMTKSFGATEIEAAGKEFDFNLHEAIVRTPSDDHDENIVVDVLQRGFTLNGKMVRPAGVRVSMGPAAPAADE